MKTAKILSKLILSTITAVLILSGCEGNNSSTKPESFDEQVAPPNEEVMTE